MNDDTNTRELWTVYSPEREVTRHFDTKDEAMNCVQLARDLNMDVSLYPPGKVVGESEFVKASDIR